VARIKDIRWRMPNVASLSARGAMLVGTFRARFILTSPHPAAAQTLRDFAATRSQSREVAPNTFTLTAAVSPDTDSLIRSPRNVTLPTECPERRAALAYRPFDAFLIDCLQIRLQLDVNSSGWATRIFARFAAHCCETVAIPVFEHAAADCAANARHLRKLRPKC